MDNAQVEEIAGLIAKLAKLLECEDHELLECVEGVLIDEENSGELWRKLHE